MRLLPTTLNPESRPTKKKKKQPYPSKKQRKGNPERTTRDAKNYDKGTKNKTHACFEKKTAALPYPISRNGLHSGMAPL